MTDYYINEIKKIIAEKTGAEMKDITEESFFEDDLNIGGLELVEILGDIEEALNTEGLLEKKEEIESFSDIIEILSDQID